MKKITLLLLMCFSSLVGTAQVLSEGFEGAATPASGSWALGSGSWAIFDNGVGTNVSWAPTSAATLVHEGTRAALMNGTQSNLGNGGVSQDWLVTPAVTVPANGQLRFYTRQQTTGDQGSIYQIRYSTTSQTDQGSFTVLQQWNETTLNASFNTYEEKVVPLNLPAGSTVYVAFVMVNTQVGASPTAERWLVDTVKIVEQCLDPTGLSASSVTQTSANLSWLNPGGATSWEIEILPSATATPTVHSGVTYNGALPYPATGTTAGSTITPFVANTEYKFFVRALCTGNNTTSNWVGPFVFTTGSPGFTCSSAIAVTGLPYSTTGNTSNFGDTTDINQGTNCGNATNYMTGNDVFYAYTATETGVISISMTPGNATSTYTGLFVYNGCANVGVSCIAGVANAGIAVREIPALAVTAGQTYIIAISTWAAPQTAAYSLSIQKVNCTAPTNLNATNITQNSATLTWDNPGNLSSAWQVALQDAGAAIPSGAGVNVTTNTGYQPVLVESHAYQYYVRAQCPDGSYSAWTGPYLFNSAQNPASIPYVEGFEGTNTFALSNGTQVNKWAVGTATNNGGSNAMYISNNNGTANAYTLTSLSVTHAYRDIALPATTNELNLAFDWKVIGEGFTGTFYDYFRVWAVPTSFTPVPGTQIVAGTGRIQITGNLNNSASYTTSNYVIPASTFAGQTMRLVFEWRNDGGGGTQPPAAIDNINLTAITCSAPSAPLVQSVGQNNANISWTAPANGASSYDYYVSTVNTAPTATTTPTGTAATTTTPISGLTASTTYYFWVRSNCGTNGTSTWTGPLSIMTTQVPGTLTYTDGFEGTNQWTLLNGTQTNKWVVGSAVSNGGTQSLYISNTNGTTNAYSITSASVVQAYRDITVPATANELNVAFDWRNVGEGFTGTFWDYFRVWAVPTSYVPTPGTQIIGGAGMVQLGGNINNSATFNTANYVLNAANFAGQTMRLVFEWRNDGGGGAQPPAAIDNVNISVITCSAPSALVVNTAGQTSAGISWAAPANGAASYDYYVSTTNVAPTTSSTVVNVTTTNATLQGLQPSTTYYVWVRSNCGTDGTSNWVGPVQVITTQIPAPLNFIEGFEGTNTWTLNNGTQVNKWAVGSATSNGGTQSLYISNNNGVANAYATASTSTVQAYRDIQMPTVVGDVSLTFDWKAVGEGFTGTFYDYFRVWVVPTTFNPVAGTQITAASGGFQLGANYNNSSVWTTPNFIFDASQFSNQTMRLIFEWRNDGSGGAQPPAAIDNINLSLLTCPRPVNLLATSNTTNSDIVLTWTPVGTEVQWEIVVQENGAGAPTSGQIVSSPTFTYTATEGVFYEFYVRAICSATDTSIWSGPEQFSIYSPPGCASVDLIGVGVDIVDAEIILCAEEDNCVNLSASYFGIGATTSYTVESIEYDPPFPFENDNPADQISANTDDVWSPEKPLPFNFCFFGQNYDSCWISSNGVISFNPQTAGAFSSYTVPTTQIPTNQVHMNSIMLFQDIDPRYNQPFANISAKVLGTSPCRALVVNFNSVPYFNSNTNPAGMVINTYQMVLYEISNIIEIYVLDKPDPNALMSAPINGGRAVMGIQNADGTLGYAPPGRNTGVWSASQEAWRFSPSGESNVDFQWLKNGAFYSNDLDIEVCVTELTTMVAQATYATCSGEVITKENEVTIRTTEPLPTNDPITIVTCSATGNPVFDMTPNNAVITGNITPADLLIEYYLTQEAADLGDSTAAIQNPEAFAGTPGQTIYVRISYVGTNCYVVKSFLLELGSNTPAVTQFSYATPVCIADATNPMPIPSTGFTTGGVYSSDDVTVNPATGEIDLSTATAGTHDITYTVNPTGCNEGGNFTAQVTVNALPVADILIDVEVCDSYTLQPLSANNNYFTATNGGGTALQAGAVITNSQTVYVYSSTGAGCSDESEFDITISPSPIVSVTGACQGSTYIIEASIMNENLSVDNFTFAWIDSNGVAVGNTPTITVTTSGDYFVTVTPVAASTVDCSVTETFEANGTTCQIPKGISPNGDGKNDTFDLTGLQVRKISIFNRYGTVVFDYSNYTDQWHGQSNKGDELPDGTYFYSFEREGGESKTGWIYINRQRN